MRKHGAKQALHSYMAKRFLGLFCGGFVVVGCCVFNSFSVYIHCFVFVVLVGKTCINTSDNTSQTSNDRPFLLRPVLAARSEFLSHEERSEREREMFYLTTHSTHFTYGYMASDIWLRTILIVREETRCRHIGYSYRLTARVLLYAPSHRQDNTYHGLCYTSRGALAGTRNSSMGPPHEGSIRRPTAP